MILELETMKIISAFSSLKWEINNLSNLNSLLKRTNKRSINNLRTNFAGAFSRNLSIANKANCMKTSSVGLVLIISFGTLVVIYKKR